MRKEKREKILASILTGLMIIVMSVSPVFGASETYTSGYYEYIIEDESVSITGYFGADENISVPSSIVGYPVSTIKAGAFTSAKNLKSITLPDTIMSVEAGAFKDNQQVIYSGRPEDNGDSSDEAQSQSPGTSAGNDATPPANGVEGDEMDDDIESMESIEPLDTSDSTSADNPSEVDKKAEDGSGSAEDSDSKSSESKALSEKHSKINPVILGIDVVVIIALIYLFLMRRKKK